MKTNLKKLFALLLTFAMVLPMVAPILPVSATETQTEDVYDYVYLSDLEPSAVEGDHRVNTGWDSVKLLDLAGTEYDKGLNMHSPNWMEYDLNGNYDIFTARISPDGASTDWAEGIRVTSVDIFLDGEKAYTTGVMYAKRMHEQGIAYIDCKIDVSGKNKLKIVVNEEPDADISPDTMFVSNTRHGDAVVIADPKLHSISAEKIQVYVNGSKLEEFSATTYTYYVSGDAATVQVSFKDSTGTQELSIPVVYSDNKAEFTVSGNTYTIHYTVDPDAFPEMYSYVYLSDQEISASEGGYVVNGAWDSEKLMDMAGTEYDKGLNMHSPNWIEYDLNGNYDIFTARISPDGALTDWAEGIRVTSVDIFLDDEKVFTTGVMYAKRMHEQGTAYIDCKIDVSGKNKLKIVVNEEPDADISPDTMAGNKAHGDAVVIADPKLHSINAEKIQAYVNGSKLEEFSATIYTYCVSGDAATVPVSLKDSTGTKELPIPVVYSENKAEFTVNGNTYTIYYTVDPDDFPEMYSYVYLSDQEISASEGGYVVNGAWDSEKLMDMAGTEYDKGLNMHSPRWIEYDLNGNYEIFTARISPDGALTDWAEGIRVTSVDIFLDGEKAYTTGVMYAKRIYEEGIAYIDCKIDVSGKNKLKIVVNEEPDADISPDTMAGNTAHGDAVVIADPKLHSINAEKMQVYVNGSQLEEFSATTYTYYVSGDAATVQVSLKDSTGTKELPIPVVYSDNKAEFTVNGNTYTIHYTVDPSAFTGAYIYLCDMEVSGYTGDYRVDAGYGLPLQDVQGNTYEHGLGMHSPYYITYELGGNYDTFTAKISPHNETVTSPYDGAGIMSVDIYLDDAATPAYTTGVMNAKEMSEAGEAYVECVVDVQGAQTLKIVVNDEGATTSDATIVAEPKLYISDAENMKILVNDVEVADFDLNTFNYEVEIDDTNRFEVKLVNSADEVLPVTVDHVRSEAKFRLGDAEYTVTAKVKGSDGTTYSIDELVVEINGEQFTEFNVNTVEYRYLLAENETNIPEVKAYLFKDDAHKFEITNVTQATQLPDCAIVTLFGESYMIRFANDGEWTKISTELPDLEKIEETLKPELEFTWDYTETMMMKLFLSSYKKDSDTVVVTYQFDEALELIKEIDKVTAGIPKIIYLVGWQYNGHDTGYPNWDVINEKLKCKNCQHESALECLTWLMDEAWKYNTCVSFHLNVSDVYDTSVDTPLYLKNDLVHILDGEPWLDTHVWAGSRPYRTNHWNEWYSGFFKARVDAFDEMLGGRLVKAGTVHSDAYQCFGSDQVTIEQDAQGRAAMIRYLNSKGIDLTTETIFNYNADNKDAHNLVGESWDTQNNAVDTIVGIMPCAWRSTRDRDFYLRYPASVISHVIHHDACSAFIFGSSANGESDFSLGEDGANPNWESQFTSDFAKSTAISFYMYQFDRESLNEDKTICYYSNGLIADYNSKKVYFQNTDLVLRENNDIFVPMVWEEDAVLAYSETGYTDKTWTFTPDWTDEAYTRVDVYVNNKDGRTFRETVKVVDGKVTLSVDANQLLIIKPHYDAAATVGDQQFDSVNQAVDAADGQTVCIGKDTDEAITISANVTIDLAGCTLSNVTVAEGATLTLIDTATDDYKGEYGTATVTGTGTVETFAEVDGKTYLVVGENGVYSAHCYDVAITHISLHPAKDALGYKAQVMGDEIVQSYVKNIGFNLWVNDGQAKTYEKANTNVTLRLKNILANNGGEMNINATVFVTLAVGKETTTKTGSQQTTTMKQTLQQVNAAWESYTEAQQTATKALCDSYYETVSAWMLHNIYPGAEAEMLELKLEAATGAMSLAGGFTVSNGQLTAPNNGEGKVILSDTPAGDKTVSVELHPNGSINSGIYLGASNASAEQDSIDGIAVIVESTSTDNPNRLDILIGSFPVWEELHRYVIEGDAALFTDGVKEPVTLTVVQNGNDLTATVALISDPSKSATTTYTYTGSYDLSNGQVGLRSQYNDCAFDNFRLSCGQQIVQYSFTSDADVEGLEFYHSVWNEDIVATSDDTLALHEAATFTNGVLTMDINTNGNKEAGVVFGADAEGKNYYLFRLTSDRFAQLVKVENGAQTVLASKSLPAGHSPDSFNRLEVVRNGNQIACYYYSSADNANCYIIFEDAQALTGDCFGFWAKTAGASVRNITLSE